jgi:hypothetical protein
VFGLATGGTRETNGKGNLRPRRRVRKADSDNVEKQRVKRRGSGRSIQRRTTTTTTKTTKNRVITNYLLDINNVSVSPLTYSHLQVVVDVGDQT